MVEATLIRWNDDKGYGFLQPDKGKKEIFLHIKKLPPYQRRPRLGDRLQVTVGEDSDGQIFAETAKIRGLALSLFTQATIMATLLLVVYAILVIFASASLHLGAVYLVMSLITITAYGADKNKAIRQQQRISERRLHLLEFFGGWPGALLAQHFFRHKNKKFSYQAIFWLIVACHGGAWYYAHGHQVRIDTLGAAVTSTAKELLKAATVAANQHLPPGLVNLLPHPPLLSATSPSPGQRSVKKPPQGVVITKGTIREIRPESGLLITLDKGLEGVVSRATLTTNFAATFTVGETVRFAILNISQANGKSRAEGLIVDP